MSVLSRRSLFSLVLGLTACASTGEGPGDVCQEAIDVIAECTGETPEYPEEGCVAEFEATAQAIVDAGCDGIGPDGKSDELCNPIASFFGLCKELELSEAARISSLDEVCPGSRNDELCNALRAEDFPRARDAARELAAGVNLTVGEVDPALRYYMRERIVSLVVWHKLTADGTQAAPAGYAQAAGAALDEHYPAYKDDPSQFALARTEMSPLSATNCTAHQVIVYFPGVVRGATLNELQPQLDAVRRDMPCLDAIRIETGNFLHPSVNAQLAIETLAQFEDDADVRFHFIGYSQGSSTALRTLVDAPQIADKTLTSLGLNSAAHGSEVANAMFDALEGAADDSCATLPEFMRPTCRAAGDGLLGLVQKISVAMAVPLDVQENLLGHLDGIRSLTTIEAAEFWDTRGVELPRHTLYTSFRSVISDADRNLPISNRLFFKMLERVGGTNPFNDMQVRLPNQSIGGSVADREVELAVAEGNHWQWELNTDDVDPNLMPAHMSERTPQTSLALAYFKTLFELGIVF